MPLTLQPLPPEEALEAAKEEYKAALRREVDAYDALELVRVEVGAAHDALQEAKRRVAATIPVDRTNVQLTDGSPVPADGSHKEHTTGGMQKGYVVLAPEERAKGFVRPYRDAYRHIGRVVCGKLNLIDGVNHICVLKPDHEGQCRQLVEAGDEAQIERAYQHNHLGGCDRVTTMSRALAETYARDPSYYTGTYCSTCGGHFPVGADGEFTWYEMDGTEGPKVGT